MNSNRTACAVLLRSRRRLSATLALALVTVGDCAVAWEFIGTETNGRLDNPRQEYFWWTGDQNGNGIPDDSDGPPSQLNGNHALNSGSRERFASSDDTVIEQQGPHDEFAGFTVLNGNGTPLDLTARFLNVYESDTTPRASISGYSGIHHLPRDFGPTWDTLSAAGRQRWWSAQLAKSLQFQDVKDVLGARVSQKFEAQAGLRFIGEPNDLEVRAYGGVLGSMFLGTYVNNQSLGPTLGASWQSSVGRFRFLVGASQTMAYRLASMNQTAQIGAELIAGQSNYILWSIPTHTTSKEADTGFSPVAEARVHAEYHLTRDAHFFVGWDALYQSGLRAAYDSVRYSFPSMGISDGDIHGYDYQTVFAGVQLRR